MNEYSCHLLKPTIRYIDKISITFYASARIISKAFKRILTILDLNKINNIKNNHMNKTTICCLMKQYALCSIIIRIDTCIFRI